MSEPVDILEVAANRLADARMLVRNCMMQSTYPDPRSATVNLEIARIQLRLAEQDIAAVSHVMEELR